MGRKISKWIDGNYKFRGSHTDNRLDAVRVILSPFFLSLILVLDGLCEVEEFFKRIRHDRHRV